MRVLILSFSFLICAFPAQKTNVKIRGYVTAVHSQNSFEVEDYRISRDPSLNVDFENEDDAADSQSFRDVRIGTEMEVKGEYDSDTHELRATSIKVMRSELKKVKRTALDETVPDIQKRGASWEGKFRVDGQNLIVDERTKLTIVPNRSQQKAQKEADKAAKKAAHSGEPSPPEAAALVRLDDIRKNMFVSYEGMREADGRIRALTLEFMDNELSSGEARLWKTLKPKIKAPKGEAPGELRIRFVGKFKMLPSDEVQQYVRRVGESLIPASQKDLADGDPNKFPFQFFVVEKNAPNAFAVANGTVVVHSGLFRAVENEAQLAFVIGHEIVHATQEHTIRQFDFHKKKRMALAIGATVASVYGAYGVQYLLNLALSAITNGYARHLENQSDRLGMEYMLAAGYDPREAPKSWKAMSRKHGDRPMNFFWSSHDSKTTRRSYLMAELRNNYEGADFELKKRDSEDFRRAAEFFQAREKSRKK